MERWFGKTAVVTGAGGGIGSATALVLANAGFRVVGIDVRAEMVKEIEIPGKGSITSRKCDLSKPQEVEETFRWIEEEFGGIDVLVNNAGLIKHGPMTEIGNTALTDDDISSFFDVNIKAVVLCSRRAVASMKKRRFDGHIVNICSIAGHYIPFSSAMNVYTSTKHAVNAFTQSLAVELAAFHSMIKTTNISPGLVQTAMAKCEGLPELHAMVDGMPALRPLDVAEAILYAVSTPPHVNISELIIQPVGEKKL